MRGSSATRTLERHTQIQSTCVKTGAKRMPAKRVDPPESGALEQSNEGPKGPDTVFFLPMPQPRSPAVLVINLRCGRS